MKEIYDISKIMEWGVKDNGKWFSSSTYFYSSLKIYQSQLRKEAPGQHFNKLCEENFLILNVLYDKRNHRIL